MIIAYAIPNLIMTTVLDRVPDEDAVWCSPPGRYCIDVDTFIPTWEY